MNRLSPQEAAALLRRQDHILIPQGAADLVDDLPAGRAGGVYAPGLAKVLEGGVVVHRQADAVPQEAAALLRRQDHILILTHRRPDGDTTGCAAGLCRALRQLGKTAWLLKNPDMTSINAVYVDGLWAPEDFSPAFVVSVDVAARSLFFPAAEPYIDPGWSRRR